ncbi:hypothetical protein K2X92_04585, partial [Candidatus Gracilibacteria bacterium]|nr:hypothetical protein [Candidatus Gracilibacteria bacterium]
MYKTEFGSFNGTNWETFCKQALKMRYIGKYQDMPATFGGDLGIEGFVRDSGQVFQCYCPEENCDTKKLYEEQRDKMTTDIQKLIDNVSKLGSHIGKEIKIKEWIFIVPQFNNKDLHQHARNKEKKVKSEIKGLIHESFCITIWDIDELRSEFASLQKLSQEY